MVRVLFLGAGAVGGYFGGKIAKLLLSQGGKNAGHDVTFLVRPARMVQLRRDGLRIEEPSGQVTTVSPVQLVTFEPKDGAMEDYGTPFDVIVLACKAYGLDGALDAIAPFVRPGIAILPLLNGMAHLEAIDERFPMAAVWGGTCGISAMLTPGGTVLRMTESQFVTAGVRPSSSDSSVNNGRAVMTTLIELMQEAGIEANISDDIVEKMWEKWTFLATLGAATCLLDGSIGEILATGEAGRAYLQGVFHECNAVAAAESGIVGTSLSEDDEATLRQLQRRQVYERVLGDPSSIVRASMARDMANGSPTEADHILGDMIRRADRHGIKMPLLSIAYARLQVYENQRIRKLTTQNDTIPF